MVLFVIAVTVPTNVTLSKLSDSTSVNDQSWAGEYRYKLFHKIKIALIVLQYFIFIYLFC